MNGLWTAREIEVRVAPFDGIHIERIQAEVYAGLLAVHEVLKKNRRKGRHFGITHLPTGLSLSEVAGVYPDAASAKVTAEILAGALNDWMITPHQDGIAEIGRRLKAIVIERVGQEPFDRFKALYRAPRVPAQRPVFLNNFQAEGGSA